MQRSERLSQVLLMPLWLPSLGALAAEADVAVARLRAAGVRDALSFTSAEVRAAGEVPVRQVDLSRELMVLISHLRREGG